MNYNNLSEQEQIKIVKGYAYSIQWIKNPSELIQLEAVKQNGCSICCIKNPTEQV
jgi:hypothetical protein